MNNHKERIKKARERLLKGVGTPIQSRFEVDDFQKEAIDLIAQESDVLVVAPTGSGKTHIAVEAIRTVLKQGKKAIYTTPLKALSNTKYAEFQRIFGAEYTVGILTGDRKIEGDAHVVIATTEIYRNELYRSSERYQLVILDEVHYISDSQRGPVWEETIVLTPTSSTLLMLSASISNPEEIREWIEDTRGKDCRVVLKEKRPVELRYAFLHPEWGVIPLADEDGRTMPEVSSFYMDAEASRMGRGGRDRGDGWWATFLKWPARYWWRRWQTRWSRWWT